MPVRIDNANQVANGVTPSIQGGAIGSGNNAAIDNPWPQGGYDMSSDENNASTGLGMWAVDEADDGDYVAHMSSDTSNLVGKNNNEESLFGINSSTSLANYLKEHPGSTPEEAMQFMSQYSEEWAEKYIDYILEKQDRDAQNAYVANREDTAYQRLVQDLKKAGLNPAMMYGSSASPSSANSVGTVGLSEGATYKSVNNYTKLKKTFLSYLLYQWQKTMDETDRVLDVEKLLFGLIGDLIP